MIKTTYQIKLEKSLYEYESHKTNNLHYAVYFNDIDLYQDHHFPIHWHKEIELCFITNGKIKILVNQNEIILNENEAIFINSNVLHGFIREDSCQFISILFDSYFIAETGDIYNKYIEPIINSQDLSFVSFKQDTEWHKEVIDMINEIYILSKDEPIGYEVYIRNSLSKLILNLYINNQEYMKEHTTLHNEVVMKMVQYIKDNFMLKITVNDIAQSANVSKRDCYRKFHQFMNISPNRYLETIRINHALELLNDSQKNITEICYESGFFDSSYFCNKFKKMTGMSPNQYRKIYRNNK